ncbi:MAG TPA: hypothetical protein VER14_03825 [Phototrophicaceae bacterium]|nr:hypothetical protein [Phototrophicaceae bacterium]
MKRREVSIIKSPDHCYEFDNEDLSLGIKYLETGKNLTFFELLTSSKINDLLVDKTIGSFKVIAVTKDGPNIYLLTEDRQVVQLKLKQRIDAMSID